MMEGGPAITKPSASKLCGAFVLASLDPFLYEPFGVR